MRDYARIDRESGEYSFIKVGDRSDPRRGQDRARWRFVKLSREPGPHDRFDGRRLVRCAASAEADALEAIDRAHGLAAIAAAHARKAIEAGLIVAGIAIEGLVSREAAATGEGIADLARRILDRDVADNAELTRITNKRAARAQQEN